ncbi:MAG: HNH endonuclease [Cyanobacteria bacterium J06648_16]
MARLEIEHILPISRGGGSDLGNLWLACPICNRYKSNKTEATEPETDRFVPLFNPRCQQWIDHFTWTDDGLR